MELAVVDEATRLADDEESKDDPDISQLKRPQGLKCMTFWFYVCSEDEAGNGGAGATEYSRFGKGWVYVRNHDQVQKFTESLPV